MDRKHLNIAIVHNSLDQTGVAQTIHHQARMLKQMGHSVLVIAGNDYPLLFAEAGVDVVEIPALSTKDNPGHAIVQEELIQGRITDHFHSLMDAILIALHSSCRKMDVLIVHNMFTLDKHLAATAALFELMRQMPDMRVIGWHHDSAWIRNPLRDDYPWNLMKTPAAVRHVTVSETRRAQFAELFGIPREDILVCPPGVQLSDTVGWTEDTAFLVEEYKLLQAHKVIFMPARFSHNKNIPLALKVLREMRLRSNTDIRLLISGPPLQFNAPEQDELFNAVLNLRAELELEDAVHIVYTARNNGMLISNKTVISLYTLAHAVWALSTDEGYYMPGDEAALMGIPLWSSPIEVFKTIRKPLKQSYVFDSAEPVEVLAQQMLLALEFTPEHLHDRDVIIRQRTWAQRFIPVFDILTADLLR